MDDVSRLKHPCYLAFLISLFSYPAIASESPASEKCASIKEVAKRVECYDSAANNLPKKLPIVKNNTTKLSDTVSEGEKLYRIWEKKFPSSRVKVWGGATNSPSIELCVPTHLWNKATKQQKISLTYYAESMISAVKSEPNSEAWINVRGGRGSAAFEFQSKKLANIQPGAWFISIARMKPGAYDTVSCEDVPVMGDYEWQQEVNKAKENGWKLPGETSKASIFRGLK